MRYISRWIPLSRLRLFWKADLSQLIQSEFSNLHSAYSRDIEVTEETPMMRFEKLDSGEYLLDFIKPQKHSLKIYNYYTR